MNNNFPKISIITPSYNQGQFIEETILSIINQGYPNLEYIIIDGGSTDNTVEIIKKYEKHISYWISEPDKGQSDAINKGIAVATGDVFNWVNSDDMLLPNALHLVGNCFKKEELQILCTQIQLLKIDNTTSISGPTIYNTNMLSLLLSQGLAQPGMYWKMDIIKKLKGVNPSFNYSMDLDLWKRFLFTFEKKNIETLYTPTCLFRFHNQSKTGGNFEDNFEKFELENNAALQQYAKFAGNEYIQLVQKLFPKYKKSLAIQHAHSEINGELIAKLLQEYLYLQIQKYFFSENFKRTYDLLKFIDKKYFNKEQIKNIQSYKRWSFFKQILP